MKTQLPKDKLPVENRQTLLMKQSELKNELDLQFADIKDDATDVGKKALIVGGTLFAAYQVVKLVTKSNSGNDDFDSDQPVLEEKRKLQKRGPGAPLVYKKEQKVGLTFGQLLKQQMMTVGALIIASKVKGILRKNKIIEE
jgi:hypothetical protein